MAAAPPSSEPATLVWVDVWRAGGKAGCVVLGSFADVCVADVGRSVEFYRQLLGFDVITDLGWYAELGADGHALIAFVERGHETIPEVASTSPRGVILSFEVDDVAPAYEAANRLGCEIVIELAAELGQHHFMVT